MNVLLRGESGGAPVIVEADSPDPGVSSVSGKPGEKIIDVRKGFEGALDKVRSAAVPALRTFRGKSFDPDEVSLEFGLNLRRPQGPL